MNKKYAKLLEAIVNEDEDTAEEIFHDIVVETSRKIYLEQAEEAFEEMVDEEDSIEEDDVDEGDDIDEDKEVDEGDEVDEDKEVDESEDDVDEACDSHYSHMNQKGSKDNMKETEEVDEDEELDEMPKKYKDKKYGKGKMKYESEEVDEDEEVDENRVDEMPYGGGDMEDDFADEVEHDEAGLTMDDAEDDLEGGMDYDGDGDDYDHHDDVGGEEALEDRVVDLEAELDELKAEFDAMMGDEMGGMDYDGEGDMDGDMNGDEELGMDGGDDEMNYGDDEEMDYDKEEDEDMSPFEGKKSKKSMDYKDKDKKKKKKKKAVESKPARRKSAGEIMKEYVNVIDSAPGADKKDSESTGDHTKSVVAGPNDMGGTTQNLGGREGSKGHNDSPAYRMTSTVDDAGNVNTVPGKAGYKKMSNAPAGHGSEKKGKGEEAGVNDKSLFNRPARKGNKGK